MGSFFIEKVFKSPVETVPDQVAISSEICVSPLQDYPKRKRGLRVVPKILRILMENNNIGSEVGTWVEFRPVCSWWAQF
jgi:hypothetical protein